MGSTPYVSLVAVGACYIDTILTVPAYPAEDEKQRASAISKRRGGNCPNTLEVLQQLFFRHNTNSKGQTQAPELILLSTLPAPDSADAEFIADSFTLNTDLDPDATSSQADKNTSSRQQTSRCAVNLSYVFHRNPHPAASSYIIQSQSTNSRTIVNYNPLDEMTFPEFQDAIEALITSLPITDTALQPTTSKLWFHFEGRIPETTLQCIRWLRSLTSSSSQKNHTDNKNVTVTISVECEKPQRPGLTELANLADVVFYSKSWAKGQGYSSARECLSAEAARIWEVSADQERDVDGGRGHHRPQERKVTLCCTWAEAGASMVQFDLDLDSNEKEEGKKFDGKALEDAIVARPVWSSSTLAARDVDADSDDRSRIEVVDTVGAGDTWIAGMLFGFTCKPAWDGARRIEFANELAARKVMREGFQDLGIELAHWMNA